MDKIENLNDSKCQMSETGASMNQPQFKDQRSCLFQCMGNQSSKHKITQNLLAKMFSLFDSIRHLIIWITIDVQYLCTSIRLLEITFRILILQHTVWYGLTINGTADHHHHHRHHDPY